MKDPENDQELMIAINRMVYEGEATHGEVGQGPRWRDPLFNEMYYIRGGGNGAMLDLIAFDVHMRQGLASWKLKG